MSRLVLLSLALAGMLLAAPAHAQCTTSWAAAVSGFWSAPANWTAGVPDGSDVACITIGGAAYTVTLDVHATVSALSLGASTGALRQTLLVGAGRTLSMTNNSTINSRGTLDWQGGTLATGTGATLTNNGLLAISGTGLKDIAGNTTIRNQALTTFAGTGDLRFVGGSSVFVNATTGTFDAQADGDFTIFNGGNTFTNDGTFQKSAGTGDNLVSRSSLDFNNNGTVNAQAGTIRFEGNGTHTNSVFTASAGAAVFFDAGTHTISGTISGNPAGVVRLDSGASLGGGTIDFGGAGFQWESGVFGAITNADRLRLTTAGLKEIAGNATLTNQSLIEMSDTGNLRFNGSSSVLVNALGATFDLQSDAGFSVFNGGNTFTNSGLLRKSAGAGASAVSTGGLDLNNNGTVNAQAGTIRFDGNGTHNNSVFTASAGAAVYFNAGTHTVVGTITGNPAGVVFMDSGAQIQGSGGTLDFGGSGFEWQSGILAGTLTNLNRLRLTTAGLKEIAGNATLTNQSLIEMSDTGNLRFNGTASVLVNAATGTFDAQSDADFSVFNGGNTFTNNGIFVKTAVDPLNDPGDDTVVSVGGLAFDNNGTVNAQVGTIWFDGSSTHTNGTFTASLGADVFFNAGTHTVVGTITGSPAGAVHLDGGATLTGGSIAFGGTGFQWESGIFGTLTNAGLLRLTTPATKELAGGATVTNQSLIEMEDVGTLQFNGSSSVLVNAVGATFDIENDGSFGIFNGGNTFDNNGLLRKSGGTGASVVSVGGLDFMNGGTVNAQSGTIRFDGSSTHDGGTFTASAGAAVFFNAGTHTIVGTITGSPAGAVFMDSGATFVGGTLDFGGSGFEWQSGNMSTLTNDGLLRLTTSGQKEINGNATLTNQSLVEMTDTGTLRFNGSSSVFVNAAGATFDLQSDAGFGIFNGGNTFTNAGLLRKSGGAGASVISVGGLAFDNNAAGVITALSGTVDFNGPFTNAPGGLIQGTASVNTAGASVTDNGTTGPGTSPGTLSWVGPYSPRVGARLAVELGGLTPGTQHDQLVVSGTATLNGLLKIAFVNGFTPAIGDSFTILTASNVNGAFASVEEPLNTSFTVVYNATSVVITRVANEDVVATLAPTTGPPDGPVVIPAAGGTVRYRLTLRNTTAQQQTVQYWVEGLIPNGTVYLNTPLVGPTTQVLNPSQTLGPVNLTQGVPATIAAGVYALRLRVGTYPNVVIDEDAFVVQKVAAPAPRLASAEGGTPWVVYEVTDGVPVLAIETLTEAEAAALEAAFAAASETAEAGEESGSTAEPEAAVPEASKPEAAATVVLPSAFALHTAYPNPFATSATLRYDVPEASAVRLAVYDLLGRTVAVLADGTAEAGIHTAVFDGRGLAAGVYVAQLTAGGQAFTQRLTLAR